MRAPRSTFDDRRICFVQGKDHAIVATLHRTQSELSSTLNKIFKLDDHMGIAISGVAADGRVMCRFMRNECLNHKCGPQYPTFDLEATRTEFAPSLQLQPSLTASGGHGQVAHWQEQGQNIPPTHSPSACRFVYESSMPVGRLVRVVADKNQVRTL